MRYYIIAGERSGDLHGGNLVKALQQHDADANFRGFGGEYMQRAGVTLDVHYGDMAFMGLVELFTNVTKISKYIKKCKADILSFNPDVVILIDYGGFNRQIARFGKKRGIKIYYYIPPKVWAWYQQRAYDLRANVNRMFVILPFEKDFYNKINFPVDYVGNPVLDAVRAHHPDPEFQQKHKIDPAKPLIALLPGSRKQELINILPVMVETAKRNPHYQYAVGVVDNLSESLYQPLKAIPGILFIKDATYDLLSHARAAIVTSGTATLETALFNVPQVVVYKTSFISYFLAKRLIKVPFISLVNLIANKEVIKELIQDDANPTVITAELEQLVLDGKHRSTVLEEYEHVIQRLDTGSSASDNAAHLMVAYLKEGGK